MAEEGHSDQVSYNFINQYASANKIDGTYTLVLSQPCVQQSTHTLATAAVLQDWPVDE